ncbi:hypothetical protein [Bradyrhizobium sp. BR 1432]|uniref:hypothetical protein n=1 Tax=Bradyrhizobium sp. BR 1432 TaxID=3447966 RepID=UPI003EE5377E
MVARLLGCAQALKGDQFTSFLRTETENVTPELERERDIESELRFDPEAPKFREKVGEKDGGSCRTSTVAEQGTAFNS